LFIVGLLAILPPKNQRRSSMRMFDRCRACLAQLAIALVLVATLPVGPATAGLVSTEEVIAETFGASEERARVAAFLAREDVRAQAAALGVDPAEAAARVAALSDQEVEVIAGQLDQLPAGEGFLTTVAIVLGVLLLILVFTDIAGITNVFTFIN
jgi:hypothetical protein